MTEFYLTLQQFNVIQSLLPKGFSLIKKRKNVDGTEKLFTIDEQSQFIDDSQIIKPSKLVKKESLILSPENAENIRCCKNILSKIKKKNVYKLLVDEKNEETFNKIFKKKFNKLCQFYNDDKNENLLLNFNILGRFWNDFTQLLKQSIISTKKNDSKMYQTLLEMENQFNSIILVYQTQCIEQTGNILLEKLESQLNGTQSIYITFEETVNNENTEHEILDVSTKIICQNILERIGKIPLYNMKYFLDVIEDNSIQNEIEIDLAKLEPKKLKQLQTVLRYRVNRYKRAKMSKSAKHQNKILQQSLLEQDGDTIKKSIQNTDYTNISFDEDSNLSFLSYSEEEIK